MVKVNKNRLSYICLKSIILQFRATVVRILNAKERCHDPQLIKYHRIEKMIENHAELRIQILRTPNSSLEIEEILEDMRYKKEFRPLFDEEVEFLFWLCFYYYETQEHYLIFNGYDYEMKVPDHQV